MPAYFDFQRYLYKSVIHMSHPGFQVNFLSSFPHTHVDTLPSSTSVNVYYLYLLLPEELIATRFVLVSVSFTCHWYYRNVCRPRTGLLLAIVGLNFGTVPIHFQLAHLPTNYYYHNSPLLINSPNKTSCIYQ
jgi:hypothetical protein